MSCRNDINQEIDTFNAITYGSLFFTFVCWFLRMFYMAKWQQHPEQGYKVLFGFAGVKFLLGILLATIFLPTCPNGCICDHYVQISTIYPAVVILISIWWAYLGMKYLALSRQVQQQEVVPVVELVDDDGDKKKLVGDYCDDIELV